MSWLPIFHFVIISRKTRNNEKTYGIEKFNVLGNPKDPGDANHATVSWRVTVITLFTFKRVVIPPASGEELS